jgi:hypothetical protein
MPKTTISVRVKQWDFFNKECKAASLRRNDFLDRVLPGEIAMLQRIPACNEDGSKWLKRHWIGNTNPKDFQIEQVPILLSETVLESLNSTCVEKKVPRDAFLDCVLCFLTERLLEAVVVIKNPRTDRDLVSKIAFQMNDEREELTDKDRKEIILKTIEEHANLNAWEKFADNFYQERLSFDTARVEKDSLWMEEFASSRKTDMKPVLDAKKQTGTDGGQ